MEDDFKTSDLDADEQGNVHTLSGFVYAADGRVLREPADGLNDPRRPVPPLPTPLADLVIDPKRPKEGNMRLSTLIAGAAWLSVIASLWLVFLGQVEMTGRGLSSMAALWLIAIAASAIAAGQAKKGGV